MGIPYTIIPEMIFEQLASVSAQNPGLSRYIPDLMKTDFLILTDDCYDEAANEFANDYIMIISSEMRAHLPSWGSIYKYLTQEREAGRELRLNGNLAIDLTDTPFAAARFKELEVATGPVIGGRFPLYWPKGQSFEIRHPLRLEAAAAAASIIIKWAERKCAIVENSKIFLSHKGVNKPLIEQIDRALRMLNLKTWFDKDDLPAGDPLVRSVDNAFAECSAAVFFITGDYVDAGVIGKEIDRAIHEAATRGGGFRIIPLVLAQHGGTDERVPAPLRTLAWKTISDIEIVPTILRSLPLLSQGMVRYTAPK